MPANPLNTTVQITQQQFDRAALLFAQIDQANDRITLGTLADKRKLITSRNRLIRERQALLALNGEQFEAVKRFARNGKIKTWKAQLRAVWASGAYGFVTNDDAALLQQIRNCRGHQWLDTFRLPKEAPR